MQSDVIPSHPVYYSARLEDSYALADHTLQAEIAASFPAVLARTTRRRESCGSLRRCAEP